MTNDVVEFTCCNVHDRSCGVLELLALTMVSKKMPMMTRRVLFF